MNNQKYRAFTRVTFEKGLPCLFKVSVGRPTRNTGILSRCPLVMLGGISVWNNTTYRMCFLQSTQETRQNIERNVALTRIIRCENCKDVKPAFHPHCHDMVKCWSRALLSRAMINYPTHGLLFTRRKVLKCLCSHYKVQLLIYYLLLKMCLLKSMC